MEIQEDNRGVSTPPPVPPPVVALAAAAAQRLLSQNGKPPGPSRRVAALAMLAAAVGLAGAAASRFRSGGTTFDPHHPERSTALVTGGVYGLTRNPIYLGLGVALLAHAVHRGSALALLPIAGYLAWIDRRQIPAEEEALRTLFGGEWAAYSSRVPRWLGTPRRRLTAAKLRRAGGFDGYIQRA